VEKDIFQLRPHVFVDRVLEKLPVFSEGFPDAGEWGLRVTGLVRKRLELTLGDLMKLPQVSLTSTVLRAGWFPEQSGRG
jgi:DMSO/TMAO reductase YedYZ molybdopterin-dependent catalytic subunit